MPPSLSGSPDVVLVRVAEEILEKLSTDGSEPVVILRIEKNSDGTYDMVLKTPYPPRVKGACPACGGSLFLADGDYVTCTRNECPDPGAASDALGA